MAWSIGMPPWATTTRFETLDAPIALSNAVWSGGNEAH